MPPDLRAVQGGYSLDGDALALVNTQRALTRAVNDRVVQVAACYLRPASRMPESSDWASSQRGQVDLQAWIDDPNNAARNVGFVLQAGWCDIDLDGEDPLFQASMLAGLDAAGVDTRLRFGRLSKGVASHVLVLLDDDDWLNFAELKRSAPKEFRWRKARYHADVRAAPPAADGTQSARSARLVVMPGSVYPDDAAPTRPDPSVWWYRETPAVGISDIITSTARPCDFRSIVRGLAFGLILFFFRTVWIEGSRQAAARVLTGWLNRLVSDCAAIERNPHFASAVMCPLTSHSEAESVVSLICRETGDDDGKTRLRAYQDAVAKDERGADARIPGWPALSTLLGDEAALALRRTLVPGTEIDMLLTLADRYLFDESDAQYIDRDRLFTGGPYVFDPAAVALRHKGDTLRIGPRVVPAFGMWEKSDLRSRVGGRAFYPGLPPGEILRVTSLGEILDAEAPQDETELKIFNTWKGWGIKPASSVCPNLETNCVEKLDRVLALLTRDNAKQVEWIKQWLAWTIQRPDDKQQIAWVCVGGQGVGKSFFGATLAQALFGSYWGAAAPSTLESNFSVSPFLDKLFVFIDEAQFTDTATAETVKKLVRNVEIAGEEKYKSSQTYRVYSRLMLASNRYSLNFGSAAARDRAMFYTKAYDYDHVGETEGGFRAWAETLKPFFLEYGELIKRRDAREFYMKYFSEYSYDRYYVESVQHSSSGDPDMIEITLSRSRRVVKELIESGYIHEDCAFETPFGLEDFNRRVAPIIKDFAFRGMHGGHVWKELEGSKMVERIDVGGQRKYRFKWKIATTHELYGKAIGVPLNARFVFKPEHYGPNTVDNMRHVPWLGARSNAKF